MWRHLACNLSDWEPGTLRGLSDFNKPFALLAFESITIDKTPSLGTALTEHFTNLEPGNPETGFFSLAQNVDLRISSF